MAQLGGRVGSGGAAVGTVEKKSPRLESLHNRLHTQREAFTDLTLRLEQLAERLGIRERKVPSPEREEEADPPDTSLGHLEEVIGKLECLVPRLDRVANELEQL